MNAPTNESPAVRGAQAGPRVRSLANPATRSTGGQADIPAPPVDGIHLWLPSAARACFKAGMSDAEACSVLYGYESILRRRYQRGEVEDAVALVYSSPRQAPRDRERKSVIPAWNAKETERIHKANPVTVQDWRNLTEVPEPWHLWPSIVLRLLFAQPETLVCAGRSNSDFATRTMIEHGNLSGLQLVVPGPMACRWGLTKEGKQSEHCLANTGKRRFIVCDFDSPPPEQHASIVAHLAKYRTPALVMSSGGKSLHAWFPVTKHETDNRNFWRLAIALGADPALMRNPSQFVRMPNGSRDNGNPQSVHFLRVTNK